MFRLERKRSYQGLALCVVLFFLGFVLLEVVSVREKPVLGNATYIVLGWLFMICSVLGVSLIFRYLYRLRKKQKRKKSGKRVLFLDERGERRSRKK